MIFSKKYPYIPQVDEMDCGIACLSMIAKYYGSEYHLSYLRNLAKITKNGASAWGLMKAAEKIGLTTDSFELDYDNLCNFPELPLIAFVVKEGGISHFCVIYQVTESYVLVADPDPTVKMVKISKRSFEKIWTGVIITCHKGDDFKINHVNSKNLLSFVPILMDEHQTIVKIFVTAIFIATVNIISSYFLQELIDYYIPKQNINLLDIVSAGLIICYIFQQITLFFQQKLLLKLSNSLSKSIVLKYWGYIIKLPMSFFETRKTGEITSRFSDANTLIEVLGETIVTICLDSIIVISILFFIFHQNVTLFCISLCIIPLYILLIYAFSTYFKKENYNLMQSYSEVDSSIIDNITGIETIKSLCLEDFYYSHAKFKYTNYIQKYVNYTNHVNMQNCLKNLIQLIFNVIILLIGARMIHTTSLTIGKLMTFNALLGYLVSHLEGIISLQTKIQAANIANIRLNEVYSVEQEDNYGNEYLGNVESIEVNNLCYSYDYGDNTIDNLTMIINKGDKIAICGESGTGKSTLAKLLAREILPDYGNILVNGICTEEYNIKSYRHKIIYIPQETTLFPGTISDNITIGLNDSFYSSKKIQHLCDLIDFSKDIRELPNGINTQVNSNGSGLSGGQKQKLALIRVMVRNPQVIILDESLSAIDSKSRNKILKFLTEKPDLTIISITHDKETLPYFKRIYNM